MTMRLATGILLATLLLGRRGVAQEDTLVVARNDSVSVRLVNADLRLAIQALARYLDRPVMFGNVADLRITLETPQPVPRANLPDLLRGMLHSYGLTLVKEGAFYSVGSEAPQAAPQAAVPSGPVQLFVLRIRHARAADVAATVNALYGRASALGEIGGTSKTTLPEALRQNVVPPVGTADSARHQALIQRVAELTGDVTIIPDPRTNSLLIRASDADFELIRAAVEQLDVRPLQVLIEVVIAEVRRDRSLGFGLDALLPQQSLTGTDATISGSTAGLGVGDFVLKVMKLGSIDLTATLNAAATRVM